MGLVDATKSGVTVTRNQDDDSHGLMAQNAESTRSSEAYASDGDQQFGKMEVWRVKLLAAADQAYDAAAAINNVFGSTKISREQSYRIVGVRRTTNVFRTGGTPDSDFKLEKGDGAEAEAFSDVVATVDTDSDTVGQPIECILLKAETLLESGETLRCQMQISGVTDGATADMDIDILAIPVKA